MLGDFDGARFEHAGVVDRPSRGATAVLGAHRRRRRRAPRLRVAYTFGVDPLQQYLSSFPAAASRRSASPGTARPRERGRAALVPSLPRRDGRRRDVLHWTARRRTGTTCAPSATRPTCARATTRRATLRHHLVGRRRRLRGVPRAGLATRRVGGGEARLRDERARARRSALGALPTLGASWQMTPIAARAAQPARARTRELETCARCHARRAPSRARRHGPAARSTRTAPRCSRRASTRRTARSATRSTSTARSCRAGCTRRASPAATATTRTAGAARGGRRAVRAVPPRRTSTRRSITVTRPARRRAASPATCPRAPTW